MALRFVQGPTCSPINKQHFGRAVTAHSPTACLESLDLGRDFPQNLSGLRRPGLRVSKIDATKDIGRCHGLFLGLFTRMGALRMLVCLLFRDLVRGSWHGAKYFKAGIP